MHSPDVANAVLITVDSLRPDAISPYAADRRTPALQSIADRGTVFENAFATGNWTPFSFPSILASRPVFADNGAIGVEDSETLASVLSNAGIATGGFNAANGFLTSHWGYDEGFDAFEPFVASVGSSIYSRYLATHPTVEAWVQLATSPLRRARSWVGGDTDDRPFLDTSRMFDIEEAAIEFLESEDDPFFLWIHYMDAHTPYVPAPRYIRQVSDNVVGTHRMLRAHGRTALGREVGERTLADLRMLYQAAVTQIDASIGRVLDALSANGVDDDTVVVVCGDHGEAFWAIVQAFDPAYEDHRAWLREHSANHSSEMVDQPMLLIDDEADNASINVKYDKRDISRINGQIRDLLGLFRRSCYVGYTATPFANIFIDPDQDVSAGSANDVPELGGVDIAAISGTQSVDMTAVLLGNMESFA